MMKLKNTQECASYQNRTVNVSSETLKTSLRSKIRTSLFTLIASATLLSVQPASAYYATLDNGEVLKRDQFQAMFSPQIILSEFDGANFTGRLDMGLAEGISARGVLGFGEIDFQIGGLVKWIPFPDTTSQPAIGFESGLILSRIGDITQYSIRFHPLVSKKLETEVGDLIPYGSLPLGVTIQSGAGINNTFVPFQLVGGAELRPLEMKNWSFFGELGLNLNKSFSYVSLAVAYRFEDVRSQSNPGF